MATESTDSEKSFEVENCRPLKFEKLDEELNHDNQVVVEKSNQNIENMSAKSHFYYETFNSLMRTQGKEKLVKICQFLIRLLRNWPEEKIKKMIGRKTLSKIGELAKKEGYFESYTVAYFEVWVRCIVHDPSHLDQLVTNEEDKRLIMENLSKFGIGARNGNVRKDKGLSEICQFLIRIFRDWPKQKLSKMTGPTLDKIYLLGKNQGEIQRYNCTMSFKNAVNRLINERRLDDLVDNAEDRRLILSNLPKLGIGSSTCESSPKPLLYDEEEAEISQFLIQLLRNWPEKRLNEMSGNTLHKIWELGREKELFKSFPASTFDKKVRKIIQNEELLDQLVDNEDDKLLILDNLPKFGFGCYKRTCDENEVLTIFQFLIRILRDWPDKKLKRMTGPTLLRLWKLGRKEGLFQVFNETSFSNMVRYIISKKRLCDFVKNEKDRKLILSNLQKLGIGVGAGQNRRKRKYNEKSNEPESHDSSSSSRDSSPNSWGSSPSYVEVADSSQNHFSHKNDHVSDLANSEIDFGTSKLVVSLERIDSTPSNEKIPTKKSAKIPKIGDSPAPEKDDSNKKLLKYENKLKQMKEILSFERQEKRSNFKQIEELSKQIDYYQQETIKHKKFTYQQQSRIIELEHALVLLNCELTKYRNNFQMM